jgi:hypothetical protein
MKQYEEEVGRKFGRLTIVEFLERIAHPSGGATYKYLCKCDCGTSIRASLGNLKSGHTKSCGCYDKERLSERRTTHGLRKHPLYVVWFGMKGRCLNSKNPRYGYYGGRGIKVCKEWMDFKVFYDWAISAGYKEGLEIDRYPDMNGDYTPTNCRFADQEQQQNNKRNNRKFLYNGSLMSLKQISVASGINFHTLSNRLYIQKRPIERLFEPPTKH